MHTHQTVLASLAASHVWKGLHCETVVLAVAPLFHMLGLQNGMNMPIFLGRHLGHAAALEPGAGRPVDRAPSRDRVDRAAGHDPGLLATPRWSSATSPA
jgi:acyl-CoA synthetase (AMP-forming)/AMP-acid ligase II